MPDFSLERQYSGLVCGVDEAGRGPLAGPVVAAAALLGPAAPAALLDRLDDSKRLAAIRREELYAALTAAAAAGLVTLGVGAASVQEIDRFNILAASHLAMARAVAALGIVPDLALVDGNRAPILPCPVRTVVGGDGLSLSIAGASIVAKVTRDRLMNRLSIRYPNYGWHRNMGYGTEVHHEALYRYGPTPHHRRSFAPVRLMQGELSL